MNAPGQSVRPNRGDASSRSAWLIVFPGALGDFLCFLPTADALRRATDAMVTLVTHAAYRPLLADGRFRCFDIHRREISALFADDSHRPVAATFGPFSRSLSWSGSRDANFGRNLRAITEGPVDIFRFDDFCVGLHAAEQFARCAGVTPAATSLSIDDDARRWARARANALRLDGETLVVHPGSGSQRKNWQGMSELAGLWHRRGGKVVSILGPADSEIADGGVVIRDEPLDRVAAFLELCPVFVGNDSGISHLAGAVGCRGIALFGDSDPTIWRPRGDTIDVIHSPEACRQCGAQRFCTHRLSVARVLRRVDRLRCEPYRRRS